MTIDQIYPDTTGRYRHRTKGTYSRVIMVHNCNPENYIMVEIERTGNRMLIGWSKFWKEWAHESLFESNRSR